MQTTPPSPSTHDELEDAVLVLANRTLSVSALLSIVTLLLAMVGAEVLVWVSGDPRWQLPSVALQFALVIFLPGVSVFWLTTRARVLKRAHMNLFLIWLASGPGLIGLVHWFNEPAHLAGMYTGAFGMLMMVMISMSALMLNPRLSVGIGLWCAVQYVALFPLARPWLSELVGPAGITDTLAWSEILRQSLMLCLIGVMVALFGRMMREVLARLLDEERRRESAERENIRREAREALLQANSAAKSAFVASMSHELRTPMNAILGYAQHLQAAPELSEQSRSGVQTILSSSRHLLDLISESLDTAAIESGRLTLSMGPVDPGAVAQAAQALLAPQATEKGLALTTTIDHDVPAQIVSDEKRLRQVLTNLVGNAIKFTGQGVVRVHLCAPQPETLLIRIEDTGPGIPADRLDAIFERFERIEGSGKQGSGLGLAITRRIVEAMGGTITLRSAVGEGTQAEVCLPSGVRPPPEAAALTAYPGPEDAAWLRESALMGDMLEVASRAKALAGRDPELAPFSARVCALAAEFEDERILDLLSESP